MRVPLHVALLGSVILLGGACGKGDDGGATNDGPIVVEPDACVGLECRIVDCVAQSKPATTISGTVYAPNGTLPLWNVNVYIPNAAVGAFPEGAACSQCSDELPGSPVRKTITDEAGHFTLENVPAGADIPLVIQIGKWRRQVTIPNVAQCADTALAATDTHLPKNHAEGDIPKIALSTGNADALECLVKKLGVDVAEMGTQGDAKRIHFYDDADSGAGRGTAKFDGGATFANSAAMWSSVDTLKAYDIVMLSCEGGQHPETKSQDAMNAMKAYADLGGRVFASHWHNVWVEGSTEGGGTQKPAVWADQVATWKGGSNLGNGKSDIVDETSGHGISFATWLMNVGASTTRGVVPLADGTGKSTVESLKTGVERWIYFNDNGAELPQNFQFTTPFEAAADARCGKVVFSDMHVSGDSSSAPDANHDYPKACATTDLTPQEKALAFQFFDIASCVNVIF